MIDAIYNKDAHDDDGDFYVCMYVCVYHAAILVIFRIIMAE